MRILPWLALAVSIGSCVPQTSTRLPPGATVAASPGRSPISEPTARPSPSLSSPPIPTILPTPSVDLNALDEQALALKPGYTADIGLMPKATRYWIEVKVELDATQQTASLEGTARIRFTNITESTLDELVVMLWPNDQQYRSSMEAGVAMIDGRMVRPVVEMDGVALRFALPHRLSPGAALDVTIPFSVSASGPIGEAIPRRFGITHGVLVAPTFYPLIPRLVDGRWQVEPAPYAGDTTNSDIAFYWVQVDAPGDQILVTSGMEIDRQLSAEGRQLVTHVSGPVRDFALAMGPLVTRSRETLGVAVRGWGLPEHEEDLQEMVDAAARQVGVLSELAGPYPYRELDLVDAPGAFGGIEYPGLIFIGTLGSRRLVTITVHEVSHQWFYGLIGNDQLNEPWLDEGAATFGEALYLEDRYGPGRYTGQLSDARALVRNRPDPMTPIGWGVEDYPSVEDYSTFVYQKGSLFFDAMRSQLGDEGFTLFLRDYFQTYRYGFATAEGFQVVAEASCGCDLDSLFDLWVYQGGEIPGL